MTSLQLDLPLLLPEVPDAGDECVDRLRAAIRSHRGLGEVHVVPPDGGPPRLCVHYDPEVVTLAQVERFARAAGADVTGRYGHAVLPIRAIDGEDASRRIENDLRGVPGVLAASANLAAQLVRVEYDRQQTSAEAVADALQRFGYPAGPQTAPAAPVEADRDHDHDHDGNWYARNKELIWSLIGGALLLVGWVGERWLGLPEPAAVALFAGAYAFGGWNLLRHAVAGIRQGRFSFDIDLLMLLAAAGAAVLGAWAEGAFLLFLFSLAHALEHYALGRARNAIAALADLAPAVAFVRRGGAVVEVPVEAVATGDIVVVHPGERIPVDGSVRDGRSAVNQAPVTGESVPVDKAAGDPVFAGTVNGEGALEVTTTGVVGDRTLDRVIRLVEEAQTQKAPTQQLIERFERVFVPVVLAGVVLLIAVPPLLGWWAWQTSFYRGMALLVAASPCALALGTPSAVLAGIAQAARRGVLVKGGAHLEEMGALNAVAFDKTGTLTVGRPEVSDVAPSPGVTAEELLATAAAVERLSQHPLAKAVVRRAESDGLPIPEARDLQSTTARGVAADLGGERVEIGTLRLWEDAGVPVPDELRRSYESIQAAGRSMMAVRAGDRWLGVLGLADPPREGVRDVLDRLRALGVRPLVMLTGDNRQVGEAVGRAVGVDEVVADMLPEDKLATLQRLMAAHGKVGMVGDGVNDAPALAHATVGIAMGGAGTAAALETADVALMGDDLGRLPFAVGLSRRARAVIRQNLAVSLIVIAALVVATTTGIFGIGAAVVAHEGSTLVVIANALRLLAYRDK